MSTDADIDIAAPFDRAIAGLRQIISLLEQHLVTTVDADELDGSLCPDVIPAEWQHPA